MTVKTALITGVTGQDGAYLAEFLLSKGYAVHGIKRRSSLFNTDRIDHLYLDPHEQNFDFTLHYADMTDSTSLIRVISEVQPDEIYNLAAQSHVAVSFEEPEYTADSDALGALRILEVNPNSGTGKKVSILPGVDIRALRIGSGNSAEGNHAVLPAFSLRRCETICLLDYGELPRGVRDLRLQRNFVQS